MKAVRGKCEVYMDGGVRTGTDVLKAIALGAKAVFVGRPTIYGLAYDVSVLAFNCQSCRLESVRLDSSRTRAALLLTCHLPRNDSRLDVDLGY